MYIMRHILKLVCSLWSILLLGVFFWGEIVIAASSDVVINPNDLKNAHRVSLNSLNLWSWSLTNFYEVAIERPEIFDILTWLVVGQWTTKFNWWSLAVIGGWKDNQVQGTSIWVAWGQSNKIINNVENSVIGGWRYNEARKSKSVIWGWYYNRVTGGGSWIILGWYYNNVSKENSIVLGWRYNEANGKNNLLFGQQAKSSYASTFVWGSENVTCPSSTNNSARICASKGILIWTYDILSGVNLVVSGAVQIAWNSWIGTPWEIRMVNGCFYAYDGNNWHIFGKNSAANCYGITVSQTCEFGNIKLQEWDIVTAYSKPYAINCNNVKSSVTCLWWVLKAGSHTEYIYPSCYNVSSVPTL